MQEELRKLARQNVLSVEEVCSLLQLSRQHVYNLVKDGKLQTLKQTKRGYLFWKPDVLECDFWRRVSKNQIGVEKPETVELPVTKPRKTISELREQTGLTQSEFAEKFQISLKTLQRWEQNRTDTPKQVLYMIARILELESLLSTN